MANTPPPYSDITGISRAAMKDNAQVTVIQYDSERDAFIAPDPGDGYALDEATCRWVKEE
jgi:hypothetical protein